MSLGGLQDYPFPLTLNAPTTTVTDNLYARNVYVDGNITGSGIQTDLLPTANIWTGLNEFTDTAYYPGTLPIASAGDTVLTTKGDVDTLVPLFNPLPTANTWTATPTFSNTNINAPLFSGSFTSSNPIPPTTLLNLSGLSAWLNYAYIDLSFLANTWTGTQTFSNGMTISSPIDPVLSNEAVIKLYPDNVIEKVGKTLTFTFPSPGTYYLTNINRSSIGTMDYILVGGGSQLIGVATSTGAYISSTIGNANGTSSSIIIVVGVAEAVDPTTWFPTYTTANAPTNSTIKIGGKTIAFAGGATQGSTNNPGNQAGKVGATSVTSRAGLSSNGIIGSQTPVCAGSGYGNFTSTGYCSLVVHYL